MKKVILILGMTFFTLPLLAGASSMESALAEDGSACHAWACYYAERAAAAGGDINQAYSVAYSRCSEK